MPTYSISGTIIGPGYVGTSVALTGATKATTITDSNGNYSFSGLSNGSYTITPSNPGYLKPGPNQTFLKPNHQYLPNQQNVMVGSANVLGVNFTSAPVVPGSTAYILREFGVTGQNPAYIATNKNTLQLFHQTTYVPNANPGTVTPPRWSTPGTPDSFNYQGRVQAPGELLVAPGTGSLNGKIYRIVVGGTIVAPGTAVGATFNLIMNQNYYTFGLAPISDALFTLAPAGISIAAGETLNWSLVSTLVGNGVGSPNLSSAGILSVNGMTYYGNGSSSRLVGREPIVQLSFGAQFTGGSGSGLFQAYLSKFEMQQTSF